MASPACSLCWSSFTDSTFQTRHHVRNEATHPPLMMNRSILLSRPGRQARGALCVRADYDGRRGGAGDFATGFVLGGIVFGALGYVFAPQISKFFSAINRENDDASKQLPKGFEDDEGLERTRKNLNEKIAQLNAAIDDVSAQLRADNGLATQNANVAELDTAA